MATIFGLTKSNKSTSASGAIESKVAGGLYINTVVPCAPHVDPTRLNGLIPAPGVVTNGFQCCDGSARKPEFNILGNLPKLDDDRMTGGHTTAGMTGGGRNVTLSSTEMPSHNHTTTTTDNAPHSHPGSVGNANMTHTHPAATSGVANMPHTHEQNVNVHNGNGGPNTGDWKGDLTSGLFNQGGEVAVSNAFHTHPATGGSGTGPHSHGGSAGNTTLSDHNHSFNATDDFGGSDTLNIEPEALTVIYIVRVE